MHERDLRRQALESGKTVSRKAKSRIGSATNSPAHSRTNSRNPSRQTSDNEDDSDSTHLSAFSSLSFEEMVAADADFSDGDSERNWDDLNLRLEEIINKKRSSVQGRETALATYNYYLISRYAFDAITHKTSELVPALLKTVKAEVSEKETALALKAIALTAATLNSESLYSVTSSTIKTAYTDSKSHLVKIEAIHTIATVAQFGGASQSDVEDLLEEFQEIIESDGGSIDATDNADVVIAASQAWGFLATLIEAEDMEHKSEDACAAMAEQLESSDVRVQIAAGENIALLFETSWTERESGDEKAEEQEDLEPIDYTYVKRYDAYRQEKQLEHTLGRLASESSKRLAKRDRKSLHSSFSDILNTVQHPARGPRYQNAIDQETGRKYGSRMSFRIPKSGSIEIDRWWKLHRLQYLKRLLGPGLGVHHRENEAIFDLLPSPRWSEDAD